MNFHEYLEGNLPGGPEESPLAGTHYIEMPIFAKGEVGEIQKAIFVAMSFSVHRVFDGKVHYLFPRAVDVGYVRQVIQGVTMSIQSSVIESEGSSKYSELVNAIFKTRPQQ